LFKVFYNMDITETLLSVTEYVRGEGRTTCAYLLDKKI
jgi:hypothetical protein